LKTFNSLVGSIKELSGPGMSRLRYVLSAGVRQSANGPVYTIPRPFPINISHLEDHHDGVHRWVGGRDGHMGGLETSPQDPVFWLHHSYIDYLWEKFRERQKRLGINSEKDYPPTTDPFHQPNRVMDKLTPEKTNIEGYSNSFTRYIYQYAPAPTCANRCGRSYNAFLYCYKKRCVSRSRSQFIYYGGFKKVRYWYRAKIGKQLISRASTT
jgi:hypothetical protein